MQRLPMHAHASNPLQPCLQVVLVVGVSRLAGADAPFAPVPTGLHTMA